ncbi:MAG: single-stranded DNA-binding protein [Synechococcaceae cyanobacterium RL_1_2]|nr:single-stranded DNA-binding protein [Synechococcaceae cyanobacterium RL_1_2]
MNLNVVTLVGRAGKDPEVRYFENGDMVCNFSLAVNRRSRRDEQPDWFSLEVWGKTAEIASNYVRKGSLIGIKGSLKIDSWVDRGTGAERSAPRIRVSDLELLGSKRDNEGSFGGSSNQYDEF